MLNPNFKKSIDTLAKIGRTSKKFELSLNLTYKCPLRCTYCYVDYDRAPPMSQVQVDYVIDSLLVKPKNPQIKLVTFFGGEPALEIDIIENTIKKYYYLCTTKNIHFALITSFSVNQDRLLALQQEYPLFEIIISFDVDMTNRPYANKKPFDLLETAKKKYNIDLSVLAKNKKNLLLNKVITGQEKDLFKELKWLHDMYKEYGLGYSLTLTKTPKLLFNPEGKLTKDWYEYLNYILDPYINAEKRSFIPLLVSQYLRRYWQKEYGTASSGCGLAKDYFIDSNGTISPCSISHHQTDLMLFDNGKFLDNYEDYDIIENSYWNNPTCQSCDIKGFCPGGCMVFRYTEHKDYSKPNKDWCIIMDELFSGYNQYLKNLSSADTDKLFAMVMRDVGNYNTYCWDNSTHIDLTDFLRV